MLTRPDTEYVTDRAQFGLIQTTSRNVALVTTKSICAQAALKVDSLRNTPNSGRKVYVFRLGPTRYGVSDPDSPSLVMQSGERMMLFFTSSFAYLTGTTH